MRQSTVSAPRRPFAPGSVSCLRAFLPSFLPYLLLLVTSFLVFAQTPDDPFITFRYAANVLAGHGPVFNPGERVEGYSSPFHLLLCVLLLRIFPAVGMLFKAKLLSLAFGMVTLYLTGKTARRIGLSSSVSICAQALVALNFNVALAAVNGLETTLYATLLLLFTHQCIAEVQTDANRSGIRNRSAWWLFLAWLARPEAILVFALTLIARIVILRQRRISLHAVGVWGLTFLIPAAIVLAARGSYYGLLVPNTYYAKSAPLGDSVRNGLSYLMQSLSPWRLSFRDLGKGQTTLSQALQVVIAPLFWGLAGWGAVRFPNRYAAIVLSAIIGATCLFVLRSGGDWMMGWRFMIAVTPHLALLQCCGLLALARKLQARTHAMSKANAQGPTSDDAEAQPSPVEASPWPRAVFAGTFALWLLALLTVPFRPWSLVAYSATDEGLLTAYPDFGPLWIKTARYLQKTVPHSDTVAYSEMGYSSWINLNTRFLDTRGLTDREIAQAPPILRSAVGISGDHWYAPDAFVGKVLQRRRPAWIIVLQGAKEASHPFANYRICDVLTTHDTRRDEARDVVIYKRTSR